MYQEFAKEVFEIESRAISNLKNLLTDDFDRAIDFILSTTGRVIVCGMGKSGIIGKKIAATLASTGTPSFFMHPGEAYHGDLGMVTEEDVFVAISNSGETDEILKLVPFLAANGNKVISVTGNPESTLAVNSHCHLNVKVDREACPLQLAPTASTTATAAIGDALAVALMKARGFEPENFARFHPGGALGRRLLIKVRDVTSWSVPVCDGTEKFMDILCKVTDGRKGACLILSDRNIGIVTDGDLRRAILRGGDISSLVASKIMTKNPLSVSDEATLSDALSIMESNKVTVLLVTSKCGSRHGLVNIHDLK